MKPRKSIVLASIAAIAIAGWMVWRSVNAAPAAPDETLVQKNAALVKDTPAEQPTPTDTAPGGPRLVQKKK